MSTSRVKQGWRTPVLARTGTREGSLGTVLPGSFLGVSQDPLGGASSGIRKQPARRARSISVIESATTARK